MRSKFLPFTVDPFSEEMQNNFDRDVAHESISISLRPYFFSTSEGFQRARNIDTASYQRLMQHPDVASTSMRHHKVASTLMRRCIKVMHPLELEIFLYLLISVLQGLTTQYSVATGFWAPVH